MIRRIPFTLAIAVLISLTLAAMPAFAQPSAEPPPPPFFQTTATPADLDPAKDVVLVQVRPDIMVQQLEGLAALEHLQNLQSKHPEAFERARSSLRAKGFRPTNHVYVERTLRVASSPDRRDHGSFRFAQDYSESNAEGEILFWSWTDGDDTTWEGEIYMEVYSYDDASTWEGQIDASDENHEWIYYQKTWEKPTEEFKDTSTGRGYGTDIRAVPAVMSRDSESLRNRYALADWLAWAKCWRENVVAGCAGAAVGCIATNGGWPGCWGATCTGVQVAAGISCY